MHMCRAPPKPSPTPSPQPIICVYCGNSEHRSVECKNRPQDNREEGRIPSPVSSGYSRDRQRKPATASSGSSYRTNARSKNSEKAGTTGDKPRIPETGRQHRQPPQFPTQANQIIKIIFLTGIIGIVTSRDTHISTRSKIKGILHITLPLPLHCLQAPTCLVILLCSLQKCNLVPLRFLWPNKNLK